MYAALASTYPRGGALQFMQGSQILIRVGESKDFFYRALRSGKGPIRVRDFRRALRFEKESVRVRVFCRTLKSEQGPGRVIWM